MTRSMIWIKRLADPDVERRREAIRMLETIGEAEALVPLAIIFYRDADVGEMARQAAKAIYFGLIRQEQTGRL